MNQEDNVRVVQGLFAAFGRGDVPAVLQMLTEDVEWSVPGAPANPFGGARHGREGVIRFFEALAQSVEHEAFEPQEFIAQGDRVVVLGRERLRARSTGRVVEQDWAMAFRFQEGKIRSLTIYEDTAALVDAFHG
jgi:ketosteroid isomerase-like protein